MNPTVGPRGRAAISYAALPLLAVLLALLVGPAPETGPEPATGEQVPVRQASLVCPSSLPGAARVTVADPRGGSGEVETTLDDDRATLSVPGGGTTERRARGPVVLTAGAELAPGLLAARDGGSPLRGIGCTVPRAEQWFTGVAAGPERSSVLELVNPDRGPAVVDVRVLGPRGELEVPRLRGVRVDGGQQVRLDLAELVPTPRTLSLAVSVNRGRAASFVTDRSRPLGGSATSEWLPPQAEPRRANLLAGLPRGDGPRTLVVANPGADEARVGLRVLTGDSSFAPTGAEEVRVPPGSTAELDVGQVLGGAVRDGAAGLLLSSPQPVTATLRTTAGEDLAHTVSGPGVREAAALVPEAASRLVLAAAEEPTTVTVHTVGPGGRELGAEQVEAAADRAATLRVPERVALVRIEAERPVVAGLVADGAGQVVRPLDEEPRTRVVPVVRPGQPS